MLLTNWVSDESPDEESDEGSDEESAQSSDEESDAGVESLNPWEMIEPRRRKGERRRKIWRTEYRFYPYAAEYWGRQTKGEAEKDPRVQKVVLLFLTSENKRELMLGESDWAVGYTILGIIAGEGLATICRLILDGISAGIDRWNLAVAARC
jgi:hypothetical protein